MSPLAIGVQLGSHGGRVAVEQFERQLQRLRSDLLRLETLVESACQLAYGVLIERHLLSVEQLIQRERDIDRSAQELNREAIALLTLQAPVAEDLRFLVMLSHLCRDLERIGDYALEIGRAGQTLLRYPHLEHIGDHATTIGQRVCFIVRGEAS